MSTGQEWIEPSAKTILNGDEPFAGMDATVRDFWVWSTSDLRDNTTRGVEGGSAPATPDLKLRGQHQAGGVGRAGGVLAPLDPRTRA